MALEKDNPVGGGQYRFSLRKRFSYEARYRKVETPLMERIRSAVMGAFGKKATPAVAQKPGARPEFSEEEKPKAAGLEVPPTLMLRVGGLFGLLALLLLAAFFFAQSLAMPYEKWTSEASSSSLSARVVDSDIITFSDAENWRYPYHTAYSRTRINSTGLPNITISAAIYGSIAPNSVFMLRSERYQAESYPEFKSSLSSRLSTIGMELNEISPEELDKLCAGAMLIVPSGYIPEEMVSGDRPMLYRLLDRGVTVFYIGQDFSRMISKSGSVVPAPSSFLQLRDRKVSFDAGAQLLPDSSVRLKNPLYAATGLEGSWSYGGAYSVLTYKKGFIIFAPQTLDGGWERGSYAAEDLFNSIFRTRWLTPMAEASRTVPLSGGDEFELFTSSFEGDSAYMKVYGYNDEYSNGFYKAYLLEKSTKGEIYSRGHTVLPGDISPTTLDLIILLRESGGEKFLFLLVENMSGEVDRSSIAGTKVSLNSQATVPHSFALPTGDYILSVVDQEGNRYARSYIRSQNVTILPYRSNTRTDTYSFRVFGDGEPVALGSVIAKIDNGAYGTYSFSRTSTIEINVREEGYLLPDGMHEVSFQSGNYVAKLTLDKRAPPSIFTEPFFLAALAIALIALVVAYIFKASEAPVYGLDIPDFPVQSTVKVPLKKEVLLGLMDKVNQKYRWKYTPLSLQEIKGAFKEVLYEGRPVFISDYNLEYLLDQLVGLGLVRKEVGYYARASWEEESGKSAKYLAMFRALRDICINEAVPFTQMGASGEYDSKITILGQDMYVHFYEGPGSLLKVIPSLRLGLNLIVAEDEGEVEELNEYLSSGEGAAALLKLEAESGSLQIKTLQDIQKMIREMKV